MKYGRYLIIAVNILLAVSITVNMAAMAEPDKDLEAGERPSLPVTGQKKENAGIEEGYSIVAKSTVLELYFNELDSNLAVRDRRNGEIWYSCPPDRMNDSRAVGSEKDSLGYLFSIAYQAVDYTAYQVDSYAYCIENGNFTFKRHPNGVAVSYLVGQKKRTVKDIPPLIRVDTYKELYAHVTDTKDKMLLRKLYSYNYVSKAYVIGITTTIMNSEVEQLFKIFKSCGYDDARIDEEFKIFGTPKQSNTARINITIDFSIENDRFHVRVDTKNMTVTENIKIESISLLNNFSARKLGDPGFILVPDGSGALVRFDQYGADDYNNAVSYKADVYGDDILNRVYTESGATASLSMPMFALGSGNAGFICTVENGAGLTDLTIDFPRRSSYFRPYFSFSPFKSDIMMAHNWKRLKKYNDVMFDTAVELTYTFLEKAGSYNDIAAAYRSYLTKSGYLSSQPSPAADEFAVFLHTSGEVDTRKAFLIFPYDTTETLTTFSQAQALIDAFRTAGADRIFMVYDGAVNGSVGNKGLDSLSVNGKLGGLKGWRRLTEYARQQNTAVYPRVDALILDKPGFFTSLTKGSQMLNGHIASIPHYNRGTGYDTDRRYTLLRIPLVGKTIAGFSDRLKKKKLPNIAFGDLGRIVYTSGKGKKVFCQQDLIAGVREGLKKYNENGQSVMLSNPSLYALAGTDVVTDLPLASSRNKWFNADIPFLPMLYSGSLTYAGVPLNGQNNRSQALLRSVESGSLLQFTVASRNPDVIKETFSDYLYSTKESVWTASLGENAARLKLYYRRIAGKAIRSHDILENGLRRTVFENGVCAVVNYGDKEQEYEGQTVPPQDFICLDGDGAGL